MCTRSHKRGGHAQVGILTRLSWSFLRFFKRRTQHESTKLRTTIPFRPGCPRGSVCFFSSASHSLGFASTPTLSSRANGVCGTQQQQTDFPSEPTVLVCPLHVVQYEHINPTTRHCFARPLRGRMGHVGAKLRHSLAQLWH